MTLKQARKMLAKHKIEIRRWQSKKSYAPANYFVRVRTSQPQKMSDGTTWDGWENVGHYRFAADAIAEVIDTAKRRNGGEL